MESSKMRKVFVSADANKKRGVALYVDDNLTAKEVFKDNEGRVIAILIDLEEEKTLICNIYAPNGPKTKFTKILRENINMNMAMDTVKDKSNLTVRDKSNNMTKLSMTMGKWGLKDVWRLFKMREGIHTSQKCKKHIQGLTTCLLQKYTRKSCKYGNRKHRMG
uniref:Uncharacterized protein n=1 Tax=Anolis carolinensis TaxID=28377 RepID=A0A803T091_ANOCA